LAQKDIKIPLHPPFSKGEIPLFGKEGLGEIFWLMMTNKKVF